MKNVIVVIDWFESDEQVEEFWENHKDVICKLVDHEKKKEFVNES